MKGLILGFDSRNGKGVIASDDGQRYPFDTSDRRQRVPPQAGQAVDFEPLPDRAKAIYATGGGGAIAADKNRIVAALFAFLLGGLGICKFHLGRTTAGIIMLCVSIFGLLLLAIPTLVIGIIAFVEFIIYLVTPDEEVHREYVEGDASRF